MELVKRTPEEQTAIDWDRSSTHVSEVVDTVLVYESVEQRQSAAAISSAMERITKRAKAAEMQIVSTSMSNTVAFDPMLNARVLTVVLLCQWYRIDELEKIARRQQLTGGRPA